MMRTPVLGALVAFACIAMAWLLVSPYVRRDRVADALEELVEELRKWREGER